MDTAQPAGVGIGRNPPVFLKPGDEIVVSISGLGSLRNTVASPSTTNGTATNGVVSTWSSASVFPLTNGAASVNGSSGLTRVNEKLLNYKQIGKPTGSAEAVVFVHGLGGTMDYWSPLIATLGLTDTHSLHLFDLEGHGLSPTHPLSKLSIESFSEDIGGVVALAGATASNPATLVAHSMGCLVAIHFAIAHPECIKKLILVGPPPSPLPEAGSNGSYARAALARTKGMGAVVDAVAGAGTSERSKRENPVAVAAVRLSLLGTDPESYAKACSALAGSVSLALEVEKLPMPTLIITGDEDKVSPPALCEKYAGRIKGSKVIVLKDVGHWHVFEDVTGVANGISSWF